VLASPATHSRGFSVRPQRGHTLWSRNGKFRCIMRTARRVFEFSARYNTLIDANRSKSRRDLWKKIELLQCHVGREEVIAAIVAQ